MNFSVLMSVYSKENSSYLRKSLESVFASSLTPTELIIVEDGPLTDLLYLCLDEFEAKYQKIIKRLVLKNNMGLGIALNYGLKICSNEIVFRMDSDDVCIHSRFEQQLLAFKDDKDLVIIGGWIEEMDSNLVLSLGIRKVPSKSNDIEKFKNFRNPFNHMTVAFKKSIILAVGGYQDMPGYEDYFLWLRVLRKYKGKNIGKVLVKARAGKTMIARRQGLKFLNNEFHFQYTIYKLNFISFQNLVRNIITRGLPRLLPVYLLKNFYYKFLRERY
jgi:glycosyltransferase involved in cell wall biosynthesis